jgi:hypothetical protein
MLLNNVLDELTNNVIGLLPANVLYVYYSFLGFWHRSAPIESLFKMFISSKQRMTFYIILYGASLYTH